MKEALLDYCEKYYEPNITKSVHEMRSLQEIVSLQTYLEFLDFGKDGFHRNRLTAPSGLRNIGNTCYFNAFLQLLYHINSIRDLIFQVQPSSELIRSLKELFGQMLFSSMRYSDPTKVFNELKRGGMHVGEQYDFHEYLSLTLDTLEKCLATHKGYDGIAQDRYINKVFFGKMNQYFNDGEVVKRAVVKFGVITLEAKLQKLEPAFQAFRSYEIEGYKSDKGESKAATIRSEIVEFPAILTFFINRVEINNGRLVKNNGEFSFPSSLHLDTDSQIKGKLSHEEQEITEKIKKVEEQLRKQDHKATLDQLTNTLKFLSEQEDFEDVESESHTNFGVFGTEKSHKETKSRLQFYIQKLSQQDKYLQNRLKQLHDQLKLIQQKSTCFHYSLFALMIHEGTANSGHYFIIIKNEAQNQWRKFSDRNVIDLTQAEVFEIALGQKRKSSNVCCIFYKQKEFLCDPFVKPLVPASVKSEVKEYDSHMISKIKEAKLNNTLRGYSEVALEIVNEMSRQSVSAIDFFSEEKFFCLANSMRKSAEFAMFKELILENGFSEQIKEIDSICGEESTFEMPNILVESISPQYQKVRDVIRAALWVEKEKDGIVKSLCLMANIGKMEETTKKYFSRILSVVLLKACYHLDVKINKKEEVGELVEAILCVVDNTLQSAIVRSQVMDNLKFSLNSIGQKTSSFNKVHSLPRHNIVAPGASSLSIREVITRRFQIWLQFQTSLEEEGRIISQEKRTAIEAIQMVKDI